ncbi:hypothetical protein OHB12_21005 [Nocardia sp. NBC_01730]|nr:hypothetical protein OHB12_21005 [Nocardia sp. NBC_01730]
MKAGARIAVGVGVGYVLGRTRKMRLALSLAGAVMARRSSGGPQELLQRGTSLISSSPELAKITDTVRGELLGAARAAAVTAASHRIDSLNSRLQQQAAGTGADEEAEESRELTGQGAEEYDETSENEYAGDDYERESGEDLEDEYPDEEGAPEEDTEAEDFEAEKSDEDEGDQETREPARARPAARSGRTRTGATRPRRPDKASSSGTQKSATPGRRRVRADADAAEHAPVRRTWR